LFSTLDLVVLAKNLKNFSEALFEIFEVNVEKFKNYLNELQEFPTRDFFKYSPAVVAFYHCAKIHSLSFTNKLSTEVGVLGLLADFLCF